VIAAHGRRHLWRARNVRDVIEIKSAPCGTGEVLQNRTPAPATRRNSLLQNAMLCASPLASIVGPG